MTLRTTTLFASLVIAGGISSAAHAQYSCHKGHCGSLDPYATGSSYGTTYVEGRALTTGIRTSGLSGGPIDVSYLGSTSDGPCVGYASVLPDHIVELDQPLNAAFLSAESAGDATLVVHGPDGWRCNDDAVGTNPEIAGDWQAGTYRIWVGTWNGADIHNDYTLAFTPGAGNGTSNGGPNQSTLNLGATNAEHGSLNFGARDAGVPLQVDGVAGGDVDIAYLGQTSEGPCVGVTGWQPDHIMNLSSPVSNLAVVTESQTDTTIAIYGPDGWRCNDDYVGLSAGVQGDFDAGTYLIWVGAYYPGETGRYRLSAQFGSSAPMQRTWTFRGRIEDTDVVFDGDSRDSLYQQCYSFVDGSFNFTSIDDITAFGVSYRNGPSWWDTEATCSIVALNAQVSDQSAPSLSASVEDVPVTVYGTPDEVRSGLQRFLPAAIGSMNVDDVTINGVPYRNGPSWWDANEVVVMLSSGMAPQAGHLVATGTFEDTPFSFSGTSASDIRMQCVEFYNTMMSNEMVDDMVVNGVSRRNGPSWWDADEACMIVSSLAQ